MQLIFTTIRGLCFINLFKDGVVESSWRDVRDVKADEYERMKQQKSE